jgi:hypothetical protein
MPCHHRTAILFPVTNYLVNSMTRKPQAEQASRELEKPAAKAKALNSISVLSFPPPNILDIILSYWEANLPTTVVSGATGGSNGSITITFLPSPNAL